MRPLAGSGAPPRESSAACHRWPQGFVRRRLPLISWLWIVEQSRSRCPCPGLEAATRSRKRHKRVVPNSAGPRKIDRPIQISRLLPQLFQFRTFHAHYVPQKVHMLHYSEQTKPAAAPSSSSRSFPLPLVPVEFNGARIGTGMGAGEPQKPIVEGMGLAWGSQHNRLTRDPVLAPCILHDEDAGRRSRGGTSPCSPRLTQVRQRQPREPGSAGPRHCLPGRR